MVRIFAKYGTSEKAMVPCNSDKISAVVCILNDKLGGSWCCVESVKIDEFITFDDGLKYIGFNPSIERYVKGLEKFGY